MFDVPSIGLALGDSTQGIYIAGELVEESGRLSAEDVLRTLADYGIVGEYTVQDINERVVDLPEHWEGLS